MRAEYQIEQCSYSLVQPVFDICFISSKANKTVIPWQKGIVRKGRQGIFPAPEWCHPEAAGPGGYGADDLSILLARCNGKTGDDDDAKEMRDKTYTYFRFNLCLPGRHALTDLLSGVMVACEDTSNNLDSLNLCPHRFFSGDQEIYFVKILRGKLLTCSKQGNPDMKIPKLTRDFLLVRRLLVRTQATT